eukprot:COSAG05_NODE_1628_length_4372_cov_213.628047_5_plen_74_part_00
MLEDAELESVLTYIKEDYRKLMQAHFVDNNQAHHRKNRARAMVLPGSGMAGKTLAADNTSISMCWVKKGVQGL